MNKMTKNFSSTIQIEKPLISVLVLCYKNRNLLNGMLDSIMKQTYSNIQLIVSDDGSEDFNVDEVERYIKSKNSNNIKNLIVRRNIENMGTVRHINKALSFAKGEYIIFTAADDRFQNANVFTRYVELFEENREKVWLVGSINIMTPDYKKSIYIAPTDADKPYFNKNDARALFSRWSRRGLALPCGMAFRKEVFDIIGGIDLDYVYSEDLPLILKLLREGYAPIYMQEVVAVHSAGGVTNSNQRYGIEVRKKFFDDKELVYQKEVKPYINLLFKEDLECLKSYRKEIHYRNYFLQINWKSASLLKKCLYLFNFQCFIWVLEAAFTRYEKYLRKPIMLLISQGCFLSSVFYINNGAYDIINKIYQIWGYINFSIGLLLFFLVLFLVPFRKYVYKKRELRKMLVN